MKKHTSTGLEHYESLIESAHEVDNEYIVQTIDGRYFRFSGISKKRLISIKFVNAITDSNELKVLANFVENQLVPKGIYKKVGTRTTYFPREPSLATHVGVINSRISFILCKRLTWLLNPLVVCILCLSSCFLYFSYLLKNLPTYSYEFLFTYTPPEIFYLAALLILTSFAHELGHATSCQKFTGSGGAMGFGINLFLPVFYTDVSRIHMIPRIQKASVALSGVYFQLLFSTMVIYLIPDSNSTVINKYCVFNFLSILFNLVPFYRNDGYWLLNDLLREDDFLQKALRKVFSGKSLSVGDRIYLNFFALLIASFIFYTLYFLFYVSPVLIEAIFNASEVDASNILTITLILIKGGFSVFLVVLCAVKLTSLYREKK